MRRSVVIGALLAGMAASWGGNRAPIQQVPPRPVGRDNRTSNNKTREQQRRLRQMQQAKGA